MKRDRIYLDTSVLNFFFEEKDLEKANSTKDLFGEIRIGRYRALISDLVLREIGKASDHRRKELLALIRTYQLPQVEVTEECLVLADKYMRRKIFPLKCRDDGLHIAIATVYQADVVISWNLKHMVKLKTRREVKAINVLEGFGEIEICTPMEVIESD
jgi:predicted nucleic acid-binding protein